MNKLLTDKVKIGAHASAAAGPVGRSAEASTDVLLHAQILSWSRSRGLFAGVSVDGMGLTQDKDDNAGLYNRPIEARHPDEPGQPAGAPGGQGLRENDRAVRQARRITLRALTLGPAAARPKGGPQSFRRQATPTDLEEWLSQ